MRAPAQLPQVHLCVAGTHPWGDCAWGTHPWGDCAWGTHPWGDWARSRLPFIQLDSQNVGGFAVKR